MDKDLKPYTREWFVSKGADKQKSAVDAMKNKDIKSKGVLSEYTFVGSANEIKARVNNLKNTGPYSEASLIKDVGIDNLISIMDADGDGKITSEEFNALASADMDEFDDKTPVLSVSDLHTVYENAMKSQDGSVSTTGRFKETYTYKDGSRTDIQRDESGNILWKSDIHKTDDDKTVSVTYDYGKSIKYETLTDKAGRIIYQKVDTLDDKEDKTYEISFGSNSNERVTKVSTVGKVVTKSYDSSNNLISSNTQVLYDSNGRIENTQQQTIGNCWVLSGVNALNTTSKGRQIIRDAIKQNKDGSVTVTLKGVGKSYTYSAEQVARPEYTDKTKDYSYGDVDMNLLEMAINDYRRENFIATGKKPSPDATLDNPSECGSCGEVFYYMTGKKVAGTPIGFSISSYLDDKQKNSDNYALTCNFKGYDEKNGYSKAEIMPGHIYSILRVTKDTVYVTNPHDSSKSIAYPRDKFMKNVEWMSSIDMSQVK